MTSQRHGKTSHTFLQPKHHDSRFARLSRTAEDDPSRPNTRYIVVSPRPRSDNGVDDPSYVINDAASSRHNLTHSRRGPSHYDDDNDEINADVRQKRNYSDHYRAKLRHHHHDENSDDDDDVTDPSLHLDYNCASSGTRSKNLPGRCGVARKEYSERCDTSLGPTKPNQTRTRSHRADNDDNDNDSAGEEAAQTKSTQTSPRLSQGETLTARYVDMNAPSRTFAVDGDSTHRKSPGRSEHDIGKDLRRLKDVRGERFRGESSRGESSRGESSRGESSRGESSRGESSRGESSRGERSRGERSRGERSRGESSRGTDPAEDGKGELDSATSNEINDCDDDDDDDDGDDDDGDENERHKVEGDKGIQGKSEPQSEMEADPDKRNPSLKEGDDKSDDAEMEADPDKRNPSLKEGDDKSDDADRRNPSRKEGDDKSDDADRRNPSWKEDDDKPDDADRRNPSRKEDEDKPDDADAEGDDRSIRADTVRAMDESVATDTEFLHMLLQDGTRLSRDTKDWHDEYALDDDKVTSKAESLVKGDLQDLYADLSPQEKATVEETIARMRDMSLEEIVESIATND
ncbi:hypothetical protein ACOMHN_005802 [Nucella lapillus]